MFIPPSYLDYDPPDAELNKLQLKIRTLQLEQLVKLLYHGKDIHKLYAVQEICRRSYDNAHHNSIYEEGGITGLVDLLAHTENVPENVKDDLELSIWKALTNLAVGELTREDIREVGAFPFAMVALSKPNRKLQMIIAKFIANMANNEHNRGVIQHHQGIQILLKLLAEVTGIGREDGQTQENVDEDFLIAILHALLNISNSHDLHKHFRTCDGIRPLLLLLIEYNNNGQEVSLNTLYILNNIASDNDNRQEIVDNKGLAIIGSILQLNTYVDVLSQAIMLLTTMSLNDDVAESVVTEGLGVPVASLLQPEFYEQTELLQEALKLIVILSKTETQQRELQQAGCLDNLSALLEHNVDSIKSRALIAIVGLLQSTDHGREEFVHRYDGLKRLQKLMKESKDDRVLENTVRTLSLLASTGSLKPLLVSEKVAIQLIQLLADNEKENLEEEVLNFIINVIQNAPATVSVDVLFQSLEASNEMIVISSLTGLNTLLQSGAISELQGREDRLALIRKLVNSENGVVKTYATEILQLVAAPPAASTPSRTPQSVPETRSIDFTSYVGTLVFPMSSLWSNALSGAKPETVQTMRLIADMAKVQLDSAQLISETISNNKLKIDLQQSCSFLEQLLKDLVVTTKKILVDSDDMAAKTSFAECIEATLRESQNIFLIITQKLNPAAATQAPAPEPAHARATTEQPAAEHKHTPAHALTKVATAPPSKPAKFPFLVLMDLLQKNDIKGFAAKIKTGAKDWLDLADYAKEAAEKVTDYEARSAYFGMADDVKTYMNEIITELKMILSGGPDSESAKSQAEVLVTGLDITLTQLEELVYGPEIPDTPVFDDTSVPVPQFHSEQSSIPSPSFEPKKEQTTKSEPIKHVQHQQPAVIAQPAPTPQPKAPEPTPAPATVTPAPVTVTPTPKPQPVSPPVSIPPPDEVKIEIEPESPKITPKDEPTVHQQPSKHSEHKLTQELVPSKTWPSVESPSTPSKNIWLKCGLNGDVKMMKVTVEISFERLVENIKQKFGSSLSTEFEIQYKDSSNDLISVQTDDDLAFAFEDFQGTTAPKMEVTIVEKAPSTPAPPPAPMAPPPPAPPPLDLSILEGSFLKDNNNNNNKPEKKSTPPSSIGNKMDLIAELSQGVQLKKAEVTERKPAKPSTPHEQLLAEIRSGIKLVKVKQEETRKVVRKYETHTSTLGQALESAMMNRRSNINKEDEEEESDDLSWLD